MPWSTFAYLATRVHSRRRCAPREAARDLSAYQRVPMDEEDQLDEHGFTSEDEYGPLNPTRAELGIESDDDGDSPFSPPEDPAVSAAPSCPTTASWDDSIMADAAGPAGDASGAGDASAGRGCGQGCGRARGRGRESGARAGCSVTASPVPGRVDGIDRASSEPPATTGENPTFEPLDWEPSPAVGLQHDAHPVLFFLLFLPVTFLKQVALWSQSYIHFSRGRSMKKTTLFEGFSWKPWMVYLFIAALFLHSLNSVPAQEDMSTQWLAYKGHRVSDLMTRAEWRACMATFHVSDPDPAPAAVCHATTRRVSGGGRRSASGLSVMRWPARLTPPPPSWATGTS